MQEVLQESIELCEKLNVDAETLIVRTWGEQGEDAKSDGPTAAARAGVLGRVQDQADELRGAVGNLAGRISRLSTIA